MGGVTLGGDGFKDQEALNRMIQSKINQERTADDVKNIKENLYKDEKGQTLSRIRGLGPSLAERRLSERGVDTDSLVSGKPSDNKKGGHIQSQGEKVNLKHCKVSTAEKGNGKRKDCW